MLWFTLPNGPVPQFRLPTFNLTVRIWRHHPPPFASDDPGGVDVSANLRMLKTAFIIGRPGTDGPLMFLCVPKGTDVRGSFGWGPGAPDIVEAPQGTGRFYGVLQVDDVARGFANEYRAAVIFQVQGPLPIP